MSAQNRSIWSWAGYDWANSPFVTLIVTFVFPAYFTQAVLGDETMGQSLWGFMMGLSGLAVAMTAPVFGAMADQWGRPKRLVTGFSLICVIVACGLWWVRPEPSFAILALVLVGIGNWAFESAGVLYNSMLRGLAPPGKLGQVSGYAWGLGYGGGLVALALVLAVLVLPDTPMFGIPSDQSQHLRLIGPLVGLWFVMFMVPFWLWVPEQFAGPTSSKNLGLKPAFKSLMASVKGLAKMEPLGRFMLAHMLYADGLVTLFALGGVYVAGFHGFSLEQVLLFGILLNVTAGIGAAVFGKFDDKFGPRWVLVISVSGLFVASLAVLLATDPLWVWIGGAVLGVFVGPAQAAGRSYLALAAPAESQAEMFGIYALAGKATSFIGPWAVGILTYVTQSQRLGMGVILVMFAAALALLVSLPRKKD